MGGVHELVVEVSMLVATVRVAVVILVCMLAALPFVHRKEGVAPLRACTLFSPGMDRACVCNVALN